MRFRTLILSLALLPSLALMPKAADAARSYDGCTGFIDTLPATITAQGTWCLRHDLSTAMASGAAITVATNNVTIDCNDFKLGGLGAGLGTQAHGIYTSGRLNLTVRNCSIRGFQAGVYLLGGGGGHVIEDNRLDENTNYGIGLDAQGGASIIRRNVVRDTGGSTSQTGVAYAILTVGSVDVIDNTVVGVMPGGSGGAAYGIYTDFNPNGSMVGNRVRGLRAMGDWGAYGIVAQSSLRVQVRDNDVSAAQGGSWGVGIRCEGINGDRGIASGNIAVGFATKVDGCTQDGSNL